MLNLTSKTQIELVGNVSNGLFVALIDGVQYSCNAYALKKDSIPTILMRDRFDNLLHVTISKALAGALLALVAPTLA